MDCLPEDVAIIIWKKVYDGVLPDMMKAVCGRHFILDMYFSCQCNTEDEIDGYIPYLQYDHCLYWVYCDTYREILEKYNFDADDIKKFNDERLYDENWYEKWFDLNRLVDLIEQDNNIVEGRWETERLKYCNQS